MKRNILVMNLSFLIATLGFCTFIWLTGPYGIFDTHIIYFSALAMLLFLPLIEYLIQKKFRDYSDKKLFSELAKTPLNSEHAGLDKQLVEYKKKVAELFSSLKKVRGTENHQSRLIHKLPWFIVMGLPKSGKSSIIHNPNLDPLFCDSSANINLGKINGFANLEWRITEDGILFRVGRYENNTIEGWDTTNNNKAWLDFLGLLKKIRGEKPINGVIVTVDVGKLLLYSDEQIQNVVMPFRMRTQQLQAVLGTYCALYVLFTKCDLIPGAPDFFSMLNKQERDQAMGMDFAARRNGLSSSKFHCQYDNLISGLRDSQYAMLKNERSISKREKICSYINHMESLRAPIHSFIKEAFRPTKSFTPTYLRGIYFSSSKQTGLSIEIPIPSLIEKSNLGAKVPASPILQGNQPYFLKDFFHKVVFPLSDFVAYNKRHQRKLRKVQYFTFATCVFVLATSLTGMKLSYDHKLRQFQAASKHHDPQPKFANTHLHKKSLAKEADRKSSRAKVHKITRKHRIHNTKPRQVASLNHLGPNYFWRTYFNPSQNFTTPNLYPE